MQLCVWEPGPPGDKLSRNPLLGQAPTVNNYYAFELKKNGASLEKLCSLVEVFYSATHLMSYRALTK